MLLPRPASPAQVRPLPDGPLHFVGIGGAGQSAIAYVLAARGRLVRGSDLGISAARKARLESVGCEIFSAHTAENLAPDTAAVIATDAVNEQNPEVAEALRRGLPVFRRPEALASLINSAKTAICVAGTHGKTTTTGMITSILLAAGLNPTVLIGGDLPQIGGNARNGDPDLVIAEACEAYGGLDCLRPTIAVITNCEPDHLDFHGTAENFYQAFARFVANAERVVLCGDDRGALRLRPACHGSPVEVFVGERAPLGLQLPGRHNACNAAVASAAARELGLSLAALEQGLTNFTGTGRRFERLGEVNGITIIDDYAHHPTEIRATLQAARQAFPNRRLIAVYQPHLPSRTRDFLEGFADALSQADVLYLTDIYLAREPEQPGLIERLAEKAAAHLVKDRHALPSRLHPELRPGDVVLFMGAGNIREQADELLKQLPSRSDFVAEGP